MKKNIDECCIIVSEKLGIEKDDVLIIARELFDVIKESVFNMQSVEIRGFGIFKPKLYRGKNILDNKSDSMFIGIKFKRSKFNGRKKIK